MKYANTINKLAVDARREKKKRRKKKKGGEKMDGVEDRVFLVFWVFMVNVDGFVFGFFWIF